VQQHRTREIVPNLLTYAAGGLVQGFMFSGLLLGSNQLQPLIQKYVQAFFLLCMSILIMSTQLSLSLFGAERVVFWRESRHYSVWSYVCGKELAALPFTLLNPLALELFWYQLIQPSSSFGAIYVALLSLQWAGEGLGQLVSVVCPRSPQLAAGGVALMCCLLTGAIPKLDSLPIVFLYLSHADPARWSMQLLFALELHPWLNVEPGFPPHQSSASPPSSFNEVVNATNRSNATHLTPLPSSLDVVCLFNPGLECSDAVSDSVNFASSQLMAILNSMFSKSFAPDCQCFCGYTNEAGTPCSQPWHGIPYCTPYINTSVPLLDPRSLPGNAVTACMTMRTFGYGLPLNGALLTNSAATVSLVSLAFIGVAARMLLYLKLRCVKHAKR